MMQKIPKFVVIQETEKERIQAYETTLQEHGYLVEFIATSRDIFSDNIVSQSPDIILLQTDKFDVAAEKLLAKKRSLALLRRSKLIYQVPKINFSSEQFAKKYDLSLLEGDCSVHVFFQLIKKLSLDIELPSFKPQLGKVHSEISVEITHLTELSFIITGPVKLASHAVVQVSAKLLKSLEASEAKLQTHEESTYLSDHKYQTCFDFHGLSSQAYRNIKKFIGKNRGDNE